ncbi:MAG: CDP-2,3-bis-(O-geranylgeranyl)-sn-glycerol synthase [Candidatus Bathyarchaeota archaeon]|nr:CDP-2,3-bis-(O-geranylgeranyl)-sn-glycerol synthase [Candidatus Bathyarchaeota archaeon]
MIILITRGWSTIMDLSTTIVEALIFIFPAYCANAVPVIAGGGQPIDFGKNFFDGKPIFGKNKTYRGFFFGLAIGIVIGLLEWRFLDYPLLLSVSSPLGALCGDLAGAFIKRRLGIAPGGLLPFIDQIDFVAGALLFSLPFTSISWALAAIVLLITPPIHLLTNFMAYKLKIKKNPW